MLIILVNIVMFIVLCILVLVLVDKIRGSIFIMKVIDVIRMGCSCRCVVFSVVCIGVWLVNFSLWVNLMIRMVFFVERFISMIKLICVKMLLLLWFS